MRTVIPIALLVILSIFPLAHGDDALSVSGDFGRAWLKSLLSEPESTDPNETSGLGAGGARPRDTK